MNTDFKEYYQSMTPVERGKFASKAGTTTNYIEAHLVNRRKIPRPKLLNSFVDASGGLFTYDELLSFFHRG